MLQAFSSCDIICNFCNLRAVDFMRNFTVVKTVGYNPTDTVLCGSQLQKTIELGSWFLSKIIRGLSTSCIHEYKNTTIGSCWKILYNIRRHFTEVNGIILIDKSIGTSIPEITVYPEIHSSHFGIPWRYLHEHLPSSEHGWACDCLLHD